MSCRRKCAELAGVEWKEEARDEDSSSEENSLFEKSQLSKHPSSKAVSTPLARVLTLQWSAPSDTELGRRYPGNLKELVESFPRYFAKSKSSLVRNLSNEVISSAWNAIKVHHGFLFLEGLLAGSGASSLGEGGRFTPLHLLSPPLRRQR